MALAIGESLESVCSMQEKERKELIEVLGFKVINLLRGLIGEKTVCYDQPKHTINHRVFFSQNRNTVDKASIF